MNAANARITVIHVQAAACEIAHGTGTPGRHNHSWGYARCGWGTSPRRTRVQAGYVLVGSGEARQYADQSPHFVVCETCQTGDEIAR